MGCGCNNNFDGNNSKESFIKKNKNVIMLLGFSIALFIGYKHFKK